MSVKFKSVERVNPRDLTLPKKYYAQIINGDDVSFDELAGLISKVSSLNYGEVLGVLGTLIEIIEMQLQHGRQVHLNSLGTIYLTLISEGRIFLKIGRLIRFQVQESVSDLGKG
jgi:predicted histone-like DNA-binding protein